MPRLDWKYEVQQLDVLSVFYPHDAMLARIVAMALCLCLSQVSVLSKWMDGSSWFLASRLLSTYPTLCYKEIQVYTKIRVFPTGTLSQTPDLENFASVYRLWKRVIDLAQEMWTLQA